MNSRGFIHTFPKTFLFKFHARITFSLENRIFAFCNSEPLLHFNLLCISTLKKTNYRSHISMHPFSIQSSRNNCVHFKFLLFHAEIQKKNCDIPTCFDRRYANYQRSIVRYLFPVDILPRT